MFISDIRQEDGTQKWRRTSSQKETEFTSSIFRRLLRSLRRGLLCSSVTLLQTASQVLFVGTKKQAQESIKEEAESVGMYYVNARWLGGMLTNFKTIQTQNCKT